MLVAALLLTSSANAQLVELFTNNDFEAPFGNGDVVNVANWHGFTGPGATGAGTNTANPLSGITHGQVEIAGVANSFAGLQQQAAVTAGDLYTFSFFAEGDAGFDVGLEWRIEWLDATNTEIDRDQLTANATIPSAYAPFSVSGVAPAGAVAGRAVIALQSFQGGTTGLIRVDDTSFTGPAIPEPTALAMLGLGGLGLVARRRRS